MKSTCRFLWMTPVFGCLLAIGTMDVAAQQDPFGSGGDPFNPGQTTETPPTSTAEPLDTSKIEIVRDDPTVDAIVASNPQTPFDLIRAVDMLLNVERDDLAKNYVQKLIDLNLTDEQSYSLFKEIGSDVIFRVGNREGLAPEGGSLSRSVLDGANRFVSDGSRIAGLVEEAVRNENKYQRSIALSELRLLGDQGAAVLVEKLVDPAYEQFWPRIRQAVALFGRSAEGPLMAALQSNSLKLRVEALYLMGNLKSSDAIESLMVPMLSTNSSDLQRKVASQSIRRMIGRIPDSTECQSRLYRSAYEYLMDQVAMGHDADESIKWWRWDPETRKMAASWLTTQTVARIRGFQRARDLVELNPENDDYRLLYWVARLETGKLTSGLNLPLPTGVLDALVSEMDRDVASRVLKLAMKLERIPAAIAACEIMGTMRHQEFLFAKGGGLSPLAQALTFGSVRLKHAACDAIYRIDPQVSFPGSSDYLSSLVFLSRSTGSKTALVGHPSLETARSIAALTGRSGFTARAATSSQDLFDRARVDPDLELIVITDKLVQPGFSELIQALRSSSATRHVPILLMVESNNAHRAERLMDRYDNIQVSPAVTSDVVIARQIANLDARLKHADATQVERGDYSMMALERLGAYASQPARYPFFDIVNHQDLLMSGLASPASAANTCKVLGQLGTAEAQVSLLDTASNSQLPAALRRVAVESFHVAVQNRGLMLSRQQILDQYDRYNASESEAVETQQILGALLDVIEKRHSK